MGARLLVVPAHQIEIGQGERDHADAGRGDVGHELALLVRRQRRELGEVADGHPPTPAGPQRLGHDVPDVQVLGLVGEVDVEVGVDAEGDGQPEDDAHVLGAVRVVVGTAADEVGAHRERAPQQPLRAG